MAGYWHRAVDAPSFRTRASTPRHKGQNPVNLFRRVDHRELRDGSPADLTSARRDLTTSVGKGPERGIITLLDTEFGAQILRINIKITTFPSH